MSDFDSQHELDDELLSAYLDDELSPEERAAVEARLAADPAAEQTLRQLRAVSQAVQGLPQEALGHNLREAVLQTAAKQKAASRTTAVAPAATAETHDSVNGAAVRPAGAAPAFAIGRTRRAWMWASLAVAAALLIMVFDAGQQRREELPAVAQRQQPAGGEGVPRERRTDDQIAFRALNEQLEEPAAPPDKPSITRYDDAPMIARDRAESPESRIWALPLAPAAPRGAISAGDQPAQNTDRDLASTPLAQENRPADALGVMLHSETDGAVAEHSALAPAAPADPSPARTPAPESLAMSRETARAPQTAGGLGDAPALNKQLAESEVEQIAASELLIVRVVAKRAAIEAKAIDRVLERNGIAVAEPESDDFARRSVTSGRAAQQNQLNVRARLDGAAADSQIVGAEEDALLVHASSAAIESCLESLHDDTENFVALELEDAIAVDASTRWYGAQPSDDYFQEAKESSGKKTVEQLGWTKYHRGNVPRQDESLARAKVYLSYGTEPDASRFAVGLDAAGGRGGVDKADAAKQQSAASRVARGAGWNRPRALRLQTIGTAEPAPDDFDSRRRGAQDQTSGESLTARRSESNFYLSIPAEPRANLVPVLFVLTPAAESAPSPASENRAE